VGYALALGLGTGCMVAYVSGSPFVLQDIFGVSPQLFGVLFSANAMTLILGSQVNAHLVGRVDPRRLLQWSQGAVVVVGALMLVAALTDAGLWAFAPCFAAICCTFGFIPANAIALGMTEHREIAGSASAVLGIFQYGLAGVAAPLVGAGGRGTAVPMALLLLGSGLLAALAVASLTSRGRRGRLVPAPAQKVPR
jgi:DHA1 family bicyclomycin/chloramphenicol resistance-like MFS transporter